MESWLEMVSIYDKATEAQSRTIKDLCISYVRERKHRAELEKQINDIEQRRQASFTLTESLVKQFRDVVKEIEHGDDG